MIGQRCCCGPARNSQHAGKCTRFRCSHSGSNRLVANPSCPDNNGSSGCAALRYDIFYGEMGGTTNVDNLQNRRDEDRFDSHCDHLLVIDTKHDRQQIVGTYRMMMPSQAEQRVAFTPNRNSIYSRCFPAMPMPGFWSSVGPVFCPPTATNEPWNCCGMGLGLMRWHGRLTSCSDVLRFGESIRMQYQMHFRGWAKMLR